MMHGSKDEAPERAYGARAWSSSDPMDLGFSPKLRRLELSTSAMPARRKRRLKPLPSPPPDTRETSFRPGQPLEPRTTCISKPFIEPPRSNPAGSNHLHFATSEQQIRAA
uniref:Uncharacterized protein n=1 Tax=Triticum urartu TaxID=4572 RepID=A0A8R7UBT9_TRIUA